MIDDRKSPIGREENWQLKKEDPSTVKNETFFKYLFSIKAVRILLPVNLNTEWAVLPLHASPLLFCLGCP
jgi:hypothetical protein